MRARKRLTLGSPVIVAKTSKSPSEVDATSIKASFGQSENQSIVVKLINAGYCRNRVLLFTNENKNNKNFII